MGSNTALHIFKKKIIMENSKGTNSKVGKRGVSKRELIKIKKGKKKFNIGCGGDITNLG